MASWTRATGMCTTRPEEPCFAGWFARPRCSRREHASPASPPGSRATTRRGRRRGRSATPGNPGAGSRRRSAVERWRANHCFGRCRVRRAPKSADLAGACAKSRSWLAGRPRRGQPAGWARPSWQSRGSGAADGNGEIAGAATNATRRTVYRDGSEKLKRGSRTGRSLSARTRSRSCSERAAWPGAARWSGQRSTSVTISSSFFRARLNRVEHAVGVIPRGARHSPRRDRGSRAARSPPARRRTGPARPARAPGKSRRERRSCRSGGAAISSRRRRRRSERRWSSAVERATWHSQVFGEPRRGS